MFLGHDGACSLLLVVRLFLCTMVLKSLFRLNHAIDVGFQDFCLLQQFENPRRTTSLHVDVLITVG